MAMECLLIEFTEAPSSDLPMLWMNRRAGIRWRVRDAVKGGFFTMRRLGVVAALAVLV